MATLNCGSVNFGDEVFVNTRPSMRTFARRIQEAGVVPEYISIASDKFHRLGTDDPSEIELVSAGNLAPDK